MCKKDKYENSGQITLEASIVVPLIIMIVAFFIYMALYIHDVIAIRSRAYGIGIEYAIGDSERVKENIERYLLVVHPTVTINEELNSYSIKISYAANGNRNFINRIIGEKETDTISIQKTMPREILYSKAATINKSKRKD